MTELSGHVIDINSSESSSEGAGEDEAPRLSGLSELRRLAEEAAARAYAALQKAEEYSKRRLKIEQSLLAHAERARSQESEKPGDLKRGKEQGREATDARTQREAEAAQGDQEELREISEEQKSKRCKTEERIEVEDSEGSSSEAEDRRAMEASQRKQEKQGRRSASRKRDKEPEKKKKEKKGKKKKSKKEKKQRKREKESKEVGPVSKEPFDWATTLSRLSGLEPLAGPSSLNPSSAFMEALGGLRNASAAKRRSQLIQRSPTPPPPPRRFAGPEAPARAPKEEVAATPGGPGTARVTLSKEAERLLDEILEITHRLQPAGGGRRSDDGWSRPAPAPSPLTEAPPQVPPPPCAPDGSLSEVMSRLEARALLPVYSHRGQFLQLLKQHRVLVVEGDTGCGKTTQLPQYVLEDAAACQEPCNVLVTQPRRVSAISVATRVADERGESCGSTVGYAIRMETQSSRETRLLFCTQGVLLRRLEADPDLQGLTHVFADEVHERSVEGDLLLLALARLRLRKPELHVIVMSATMDAAALSRYFRGCPILKVPGRTFPVKALWLEDAIEMTSHIVDPWADWGLRRNSWVSRRYTCSTGFSGTPCDGSGQLHPRMEDLSEPFLGQRYARYSAETRNALCSMNHDIVNYELAAQVVGHFLEQPVPKGPKGQALGAILVFLSGAREISKMRAALLESCPQLKKEPDASWVLVLHSSLTPREQQLVFQRPPSGCRKIVLATNIAETSITIDDVGVVIDTGHVKELRYDSARRLASLEDVFECQASVRQRRGRAGRVAPGTCVHLVTKYRHDKLMEAHQQPEVCRVPLEQLVLRLHASGLCRQDSAEEACSKLLEPPSILAVRRSVMELAELGALIPTSSRGEERLTALGLRLSQLPLDAGLGKLLLLGAALGEGPFAAGLATASVLSVRSWPLATSLAASGGAEERRRYEARRAHRALAESIGFPDLGCSDILATLRATGEWERARLEDRQGLAREKHLRTSALREISDIAENLLEALQSAGVLDEQRSCSSSRSRASQCLRRLGSDEGTLLGAGAAALLCASSGLKVAFVVPRETLLAHLGGSSRCGPVDLLVHHPGGDGEDGLVGVQIHPSSVSAREKNFGTPFVLFQELLRTSKLFLRGVTPVPLLAMALFTNVLAEVSRPQQSQLPTGESVLSFGPWVQLILSRKSCDKVLEIRHRLERYWRAWLQSPQAPPPGLGDELLSRLLPLLALSSADGWST